MAGPTSPRPVRAYDAAAETARTIARLEADFRATNNPAFAWEALLEATDAQIALPSWLTGYLRSSAARLAELSRSNVPTKGKIAAAVYNALGFQESAAANPFVDVHRVAHEVMVASDVYAQRTANWWAQRKGLDGTHDWTTICKDAARRHHGHCDTCKKKISVGTVRRYWYKHARAVIPPHLVKSSLSQKVDDILR